MRHLKPDLRSCMRLPRLPPLPRISAFAWLLCLPFAHCILDDRHAGTSTSVTNPAALVTGFAILEDGTPAAYARVTLRKPIVEVSHAGVPASLEVGFAIADSAGKFTVQLVFLDDVYMEIREAPGSVRGPSPDSQQVHLRRWPNGLPLDGKMGTFRLQPTGAILGHIETEDTASTYHRWVGVRGTDNFVPAPGKNLFRLNGVPAGHRELMVVTVPDTTIWVKEPERKFLVADSVVQDEVKPREAADFGPVFYTND